MGGLAARPSRCLEGQRVARHRAVRGRARRSAHGSSRRAVTLNGTRLRTTIRFVGRTRLRTATRLVGRARHRTSFRRGAALNGTLPEHHASRQASRTCRDPPVNARVIRRAEDLPAPAATARKAHHVDASPHRVSAFPTSGALKRWKSTHSRKPTGGGALTREGRPVAGRSLAKDRQRCDTGRRVTACHRTPASPLNVTARGKDQI